MKATDKFISEFISQPHTQFLIPIYQRNYVWEIEQCEQLLNDILDASQDKVHSHFIGFICYDLESRIDNELKQLSIIDGQQRLTTLTLVFIALYKYMREIGNSSLADQIYETYLINKFDYNNEKLKLRNTGNSVPTLRFLLRDNLGEEIREDSPIYRNFMFFKHRINQSNYDAILKGLNKLTYVDIFIERGKDHPQRIYESMNSTGINLGEGDKIRNACLMGESEKEQLSLYRDYWHPIEELLIKRYSDRIENKIDDFLRDFITSEDKRIQKHDSVYLYFKRFLLKKRDRRSLLVKLKKYANYYSKLMCPENEVDKDLRMHLEYINKLELNVSYPFLLKLYDDYTTTKLDKPTFVKVLELLQSYVIRRFLVSLNTSLNYTFASLYDYIKDKPDYYSALAVHLLQRLDGTRFPDDEEIKSALKEKNFYKRSIPKRDYILERLENYENREIVKLHNGTDITVEHIFPQHPDASWRTCLGELEYESMVKHCNTIANITLSGNNGALGNKDFEAKKYMNIERKEQGYVYSRLWLNRALQNFSKWGMAELDIRLTAIHERFILVWEYPTVEFPEGVEELELKIIDSNLKHYKNLNFAVIARNKIRINSIHDLYAVALKVAFEFNRTMLLGPEGSKAFGVTTNKDELKKPIQLTEKFFAETTFGRKAKLEKIKALMRMSENEDAKIMRTLRLKDLGVQQLNLFQISKN